MNRARRVSGRDMADALRSASLLVSERGRMPDEVLGIADDSRHVVRGGAFVAVRGHAADGHAFIDAAIAAGAALIIAEDALAVSVPVLQVSESRRAAALAAAVYYGRPADDLRLIGVTGTNGKTTTVHLLRALLCDCGLPAASIGTLGVLTNRDGTDVPGGQGLTTPGPIEMQRVLRLLADAGVRAVAMEVSSHALDQFRVDGLALDVAVFTSFSRDHLDYHGTMAAYFAAKARLINLLKPDGVAVINAAEPAWGALPTAPRSLSFVAEVPDMPALARDTHATLRAQSVEFDADGSRFALWARDGSERGVRIATSLPLLGDFNVVNATGAVAAAWALGCSLSALGEALHNIPQVPGRLERLRTQPSVLRDYAHTPDALERALRAVRPFARTPEGVPTQLHVVFGCGGDRDRGKRPEMGAIAERLADTVILTSDNPRTESSERILDDIEAGMGQPPRATARVRLEDRREAIAYALQHAAAHDVVLLAGKGHETYQVRGTERLPFDEAEIVAQLSGARA